MVNFATFQISNCVGNRRNVGARFEHHDISIRNMSRTAMNTPVATESRRSYQRDARQ